MNPTIDDLHDEIAWLKGRIADLTGCSLGPIFSARYAFYPQEGRVLAMLVNGPKSGVSSQAIYAEVFEDPATGEGPGFNIVRVIMSRVRRKLEDMGMQQPIVWGAGNYVLSDAARAWGEAHRPAVAA